jgi:toxin ParE1/3/4
MSARELRIRVARRGQRDIKSIHLYTTKRWSKEQADSYQLKLTTAFGHLSRHPFLGIERPEISTGIRSLMVESHVVLYRVRAEEIVITRIVHSRQDPNEL